MSYQLDTNILLRLVEPTHSMHLLAKQAVDKLLANGEKIYYLPQNIREFWNVCTRPANRNGLGFPHSLVEAEVKNIESVFELLNDTPAVYIEWRRMVYVHSVSGVQVHDCYIAAAMNVHSVNNLLTFNTSDFSRYNVNAVDPRNV